LHPGEVKILVVHNVYQQRAGEEAVVGAEARLLEANGHAVVRYERHNDELRRRGALSGIGAAVETVWSSRSFREMAELIGKERPDVAHFHNTFPLISPSAYYACAQAGVPVVQTLHNYRLLCVRRRSFCAMAKFAKRVSVGTRRGPGWCTDVIGELRGDRGGAGDARGAPRMGSWQTKVDVYIALSEFARRKFIEGGLPATASW
jgi:hypothetical protein